MTFAAVLNAVANDMAVPVAQLTGPSRVAWVVRARDISCWIARKQLQMSLTDIGRALGDRHHSTIIAAIDRAYGMHAHSYWRRRIGRIARHIPTPKAKGLPAMIHVDAPTPTKLTLRLALPNGWTVAIPIAADGGAIIPICWASHEERPRPGILKGVAGEPVDADGLRQFINMVAANPHIGRQPAPQAGTMTQ